MIDRRGWGLVVGSLVIALALELLPLPTWAEPARPSWVVAVLLWWCLFSPQRANVGTAFVLGILMDVLKGAVLGQHALALTLTAFLAARFHLQLRVFPMWQQCLVNLVIFGLAQLVQLWLSALTGNRQPTLALVLPALVSALLWPWVSYGLRGLRRRYKIN